MGKSGSDDGEVIVFADPEGTVEEVDLWDATGALPSRIERRAEERDGVDVQEDEYDDDDHDGYDDDDDDEVEHSQLPEIEEYKAQVSSANEAVQKAQRVNFWLKVTLVVVVLFLTAVVFAAAGVLVGRSQIEHEDEEAKQQQQQQPKKFTRTDGFKSPDSDSWKIPSRLPDVLNVIHYEGWMIPGTNLSAVDSPQHMAAKWVADEDPLAVSLEDRAVLKERYALAVFFYALGGKGWKADINWLSEMHVCDWNREFPVKNGGTPRSVGVICNGEEEGNLAITGLYLPHFDLRGRIPDEIGLLQDLEQINFAESLISGKLPHTMKLLTKMKSLVLYSNDLVGEIPRWITQLKMLEVLSLGDNEFDGTFPDKMEFLTNLRVLNLESNYMDDDVWAVAGLPSLEALFLAENLLSGRLTSAVIASWGNLKVLDVRANYIRGELPRNLFESDGLVVCDLSENNFNGTIPDLVDRGQKLSFLSLSDNDLKGVIPEEIMHLSDLTHLDLSSSNFSGVIPHELSYLDELRYLFLAFNDNLEAGTIPRQFGSLTNLEYLSLKGTNREGWIPEEFGGLTNLVVLDLDRNEIDGDLPPFVGNMTNLEYLMVNRNKLSGELPDTLRALTALDTILVNNNDLDGDADFLCDGNKSILPGLKEFVADCKETTDAQGVRHVQVKCPCCTGCCSSQDNSIECSGTVWLERLKTTWDTDYVRENYIFDENQILYK